MKDRMKSLRKSQAGDSLEEFLARVEEYTAQLGELHDNVSQLGSVQARVLGEPSAEERGKMVARQQQLVRENKSLGAGLQGRIKEEKARTEKLAKRSPERAGEVEIRRTQMAAVARRFLDVWGEYNTSQLQFRDSNKKALIRNIKIVDPNSALSNEELEDKLEAGDLTVLSSIIKESNQAKEDLARLEGRHLEMVKLERGVVEVHDMFLELSHMVEAQGETVTRIGDRVGEAAGHVEEGRDQLGQVRVVQCAVFHILS